MIASGMSAQGNKLILSRIRTLDAKTRTPVSIETREEMSHRADDLWAEHQGSLKARPVS